MLALWVDQYLLSFQILFMCKKELDVAVPATRIFYKRYVDDTYVRNKKNNVDKLFEELSFHNENIKLTLEVNPTKLLDNELVRENGEITMQVFSESTTHPALRRCGDLAATSLCTSQWRRRYVSNETPNDVSMERRQDVSVVRLYDVLLEYHNDVSKGRNNDTPPLRLHDISNKSQMKHPTTSR